MDLTQSLPGHLFVLNQRVEVEDGNALPDEILVIVGEVEGLLFDYKLTMEEDLDKLTI